MWLMIIGVAAVLGLCVVLAHRINQRERDIANNRHLHEPEVHLGATALQNHHRI